MFATSRTHKCEGKESVKAIRDMVLNFSHYFLEENIQALFLPAHSKDNHVKEGIKINIP